MSTVDREAHGIGWDNGQPEGLPDVHRVAVPFDLNAAYPPVQARCAVCGTVGDRVAPDPGGIRDEPGTLVAGRGREYCCMDQPSGPAALPRRAQRKA